MIFSEILNDGSSSEIADKKETKQTKNRKHKNSFFTEYNLHFYKNPLLKQNGLPKITKKFWQHRKIRFCDFFDIVDEFFALKLQDKKEVFSTILFTLSFLENILWYGFTLTLGSPHAPLFYKEF